MLRLIQVSIANKRLGLLLLHNALDKELACDTMTMQHRANEVGAETHVACDAASRRVRGRQGLYVCRAAVFT